MKKVCFITSHLASGSSSLFNTLDGNPRVQGFRLGVYPDMPSIYDLTTQKHKLDNRAAVYMDELLYNHSLQTKDAYKYCYFVYLVRRAEATLNELVSRKMYTPECACRYYCYRLQRICEMAKRTPGAVLLMWEDINRGLPLVEEYLNLKQVLEPVEMTKGTSVSLVPFGLVKEAEESYERHMAFLYSQDLKRWK